MAPPPAPVATLSTNKQFLIEPAPPPMRTSSAPPRAAVFCENTQRFQSSTPPLGSM